MMKQFQRNIYSDDDCSSEDEDWPANLLRRRRRDPFFGIYTKRTLVNIEKVIKDDCFYFPRVKFTNEKP